MILPFNRSFGAVASAALLSAGLALAPTLAIAQTPAPTPAAPSAATPAATAPKSHLAKTAHRSQPNVVERRITDLHQKLHITADQETAWNAVAQAMRDNAQQMNQLVTQREQEIGSENAVQSLQSYQQIAQAHVDGLKTLVPAFQALYEKLSPSQQKTADAMFGPGKRGHAAKTTKGG